MPKKVKIHANERIDIPDFDHAASVYTDESMSFHRERFLLDRKSRILDGFRVEISDQTTYPGQISVYNGNALDRIGLHLNDEDLATSAITTTLAGAGQTFYVEIEFVESDTDTDARAFWDPTFDNGVNVPSGKEVALSVSTRLTPTWRIVSPVSTSGFDRAGNPNSQRIPLCVLRTNASNQITNVVNTGLVTVTAASVIEYDVSASATTIKVLDSRLFGSVPTLIIDYGGTNPETVTATSNDVENGILTFAPALAYNHAAGAIVRVSTVARLVKQNTDPNNTAFPTAPPNHLVDQAPRFWQGDEIRGSALFTSKETYGARDDLNVRSMKDHLDMMAAQLREMKFGSPRPEITSKAPPTSFNSRPRYLDPVGSIAGARTASVSIGNGTTTFGDFNGTTEAVFTAAMAALPLGGTIFVKPGTYTFASAVNITTGIHLVADSKDTTTLVNNVAAGVVFAVSNATIVLEDLTFQTGTGGSDCISLTNSMVHAARCLFTGVSCSNGTLNLRDGLVSGMVHGTNVSGRIYNSTLAGSAQFSGTFLEMLISGCQVATDTNFVYFASGTTYSFVVENSLILATQASDAPMFDWHSSSNCFGVTISGCLMQNYTLDCTSSEKPAICSVGGTGNLNIIDSYIMVNAQNTSDPYHASAITTRTNATNYVVNVTNTQFIGNVNYTKAINVLGTGTKLTVTGCDFKTSKGVCESDSISVLLVTNCTFHDVGTVPWYGIEAKFVAGSVTTTTRLSVSNCSFYGNNSNTNQKYGIYLDGITASVEGCLFEEIKNTSTGAYAIIVFNTYATTRPCAYSIRGNAIHRCSTMIGSPVLYFSDSGGNLTVDGNVFTSTVGGYGIRVLAANSAVVKNNRVHSHSNTGASSTTKAISVESVQRDCDVSGNSVYTLTADATSGSVYAIDCSVSMTSASLVVSNNKVSTVNYSSPASMVSGVYGIAVPKNATVTGNIIKNMSNASAPVYGIYSGTSSGRGLHIESNTIWTLTTTGGLAAAIYIDGGAGSTGVTIVNNQVYYLRTTSNASTCVALVGTFTNLVCNSNTFEDIYSSGVSNPRIFGIDCTSTVLYTSEFSGNKLITFNGANGCAMNGIYLYGGSGIDIKIENNQWNIGSTTTTSTSCYFIQVNPNTGSTGAYTDVQIQDNVHYSALPNGTAYFAAIIYARRCSRTVIRGNKITFAGGVLYPIYTNGCDSTVVDENQLVCTATTDATSAVYVDAAASTSALLANIKITRNSVFMYASTATCMPLYVLSNGINITNLVIKDNSIVHIGNGTTSYYGISVVLQTTAICNGLIVEGNKVVDYVATTLSGTTAAYGISLAGASAGKIRDAHIRHNTLVLTAGGTNRGIQVSYAAYGSVSDNTIRVSDGNAEILIFTCENLYVQNNMLGTGTLGAYVVTDAGLVTDTTGTNNTVSNNKL